jgi:hypothetical protein
MGQIRRVVMLLDIPHAFQCLLRRERLLGQDGGYEEQCLPKGQCRRPLFPRWRVHTRK